MSNGNCRCSESPLSALRVGLRHLRNPRLISHTDWTSRATEAVVFIRLTCIRACRPDLWALLSSRTKLVPAANAGETYDHSINANGTGASYMMTDSSDDLALHPTVKPTAMVADAL